MDDFGTAIRRSATETLSGFDTARLSGSQLHTLLWDLALEEKGAAG
ncbi:hypothetical protein ABVV53_11900 [Novosphingobium sp. RD2P27]|uniref:Uncharacterized protein n=1 Tax=Novosphingobium kalidii TaxID=3230299 RepID=A0ABV2D2P7_9SPHN